MKKYTICYYDDDQYERIKEFYFLKNAYKFLHQLYISIDDVWEKDFLIDFPYNKVKKNIKTNKSYTFIKDTIYCGELPEEVKEEFAND